MSGNTTSYRWGGVTKEKRRGLLRHSMRDLDKRAGNEMSHSNKMIDPARTLDNVTMINDGQGGFVRAQSIDQVIELADAMVDAAPSNVRRMADGREVPVGLRRDAAVMIEYILELDPEWTGPWATATPEKRAEVLRLLNVMIEEVIERDGAENVVAWSFNLDETNAHVHMYTIPVDEAGRVNMKSKFDGHSKGGAKRAYIERHDAMRTRLNEHGYDATFARIEGSPKHEALAKYKARKERENQVAEFAEKVMDGDKVNKANRARIDADRADLEEAEDDLEERTQDIAQRETDWLTRKRKLDAREADLDRRDHETADARLAAQNAQREAEAASAAAQAERARLRALREDVERDLAAAGPAPQPPSYDDMRAEFLGEQSAQLTAYAKTVKRSDGTTMHDAFEDWARQKHAKLTRQGQPVGRYETWRDRTTAAQKRLTMSQLNDAPVSAPRRDRGHGFGE